jgi:hypothetical protein
MKKIQFQFCFAVLFLAGFQSRAQFLNCSPLKFSGSAPAPWAIDGKINDWETILGPVSTSNPAFPFGPLIGYNGNYDNYGDSDPDHPDPKADLRVLSIMPDDYNIYFYFRRIDLDNFPNKAYYFFDTNIDGLMNNGEPVIGVHFNSQKVNRLTLGRYISFYPAGDPTGDALFSGNACRIDGNNMKGHVEEIKNSQNTTLMSDEIFSAIITENGYGVELAVPWRLISPYKYFAYRLTLQKGAGTYNPDLPADNAGGCGIAPYTITDIIGNPDFKVVQSSVTTIIPGLQYRVDLDFRNLTPAILEINASDLISIKDIIRRDELPVDEKQFQIRINNLPYSYFSGSFASQPIQYSNISNPGAGLFRLQPFEIKRVSYFITFPSNNSVQSATFEFHPVGRYRLESECFPNTGGGGKPINPIGIIVSDDVSSARMNGNSLLLIENNFGTDGKILLYPNPSNGNTRLVLPKETGTVVITLTDLSGRVIQKHSSIQQYLNLRNLKSGFYLLNIKSDDSKINLTKKLIVK